MLAPIFSSTIGDLLQIASYPRKIPNSVRRVDETRKEKRKVREERKEQEKEKKREELRRLKNLKRQEIMTKLDKIKGKHFKIAYTMNLYV